MITIDPWKTKFEGHLNCGTPSRLAAALPPIDSANLTASNLNSSVYCRFGTCSFFRHIVLRSPESYQQSGVRETGAGSARVACAHRFYRGSNVITSRTRSFTLRVRDYRAEVTDSGEMLSLKLGFARMHIEAVEKIPRTLAAVKSDR